MSVSEVMVDVMVEMNTNICDEATVMMVDVEDAIVVPDVINVYLEVILILDIKFGSTQI